MAYIGKQPTVGNFVKLDAITTSATTTFNLTNGGVAYSPQSANHCIVSLNGVIQSPNTSFTISGSTIVFASALTSSDVIDFILVLGDVLNIGTPSDATVGFSKITSNLITGATAETSIAGGDQILIYDDSATALRKMTRTNFVAGIGGTNTPAFYAFKNANQTIGNDTDTLVSFQTEVLDTNNCFDNSSTYKFTPTVAGKYFIFASLTFDSNNTANDIRDIALRFDKNGTFLNYSGGWSNYPNSSASAITVYHSIIETFNGSTDNISVYGRMVAGTRRISGGYPDANARNVFFGGYKIIE